MPPILNVQDLAKSFGSLHLFDNISMTVSEGERIGLIGLNGSGKSTLLQILAGRLDPDGGDVAVRKRARISFVTQVSEFHRDDTVRGVIDRAASRAKLDDEEREARIVSTLGRAGFEDFSATASSLSGGWRKRLAIAEALVEKPDLLLLDEPTNHLDLAGIEWLEGLLANSPFASVVVSHDRYFLENTATQMAELNRAYPNGLLFVSGNYSTFLEKKADFLHAQQKQRESLENLVRREIEWLRRGPKARTSKSKSRINKAYNLMDELADLTERTRTATSGIDFNASARKTRRLITVEGVGLTLGEQTLFDDASFSITAGMRVGLVGSNGSGKTTLLRLLRGEIEPDSGTIRRAENLRIVYFDQNRELDPEQTLRESLAPEGDSVVYQDRLIHVASWASRFLFSADMLDQPVSTLSGGERARVLIAGLMLQPADVLLLDEPTNDLDIPTLEILEQNLLEFPGAMVLVTHDRYLLDRVANVVLGVDGKGGSARFADYLQWEEWLKQRQQPKPKAAPPDTSRAAYLAAPRKKLSYMDAREYASIEDRIAEAEQELEARRETLQAPDLVTEPIRLQEAYEAVEEAQKTVDDLYARWGELEAKLE